jgi:trans-aconitate methyltransferase
MNLLNKDSPNSLDQHVGAYQGNNVYDFDNNIILKYYSQRVIELASTRNNLLELGLGHGFTTLRFSKEFSDHMVLEGSPAVIQNFKSKNPSCSSRIHECLFEEFEVNRTFDVIVMGFVLEHVENPVAILKKFKKYLAKDAQMFVAVPNAEVLNRRLGLAMGLIHDITQPSENDRVLGHRRYYTMASFRDDINASGYQIQRMEGLYLKPLSTAQMMSINLSSSAINALCQVGKQYPELSCGILAELRKL